ncbi:helix-turn-helix domain-containing protein [uncultured Ilumatobacter sp.]|uniref:AlbA family DNA-binding domain-containing protein n=1 Tax=uncultured Ilumatobacter sp. TaxID=879968 RepID=UPI00374F2FE4
MTLALQQRQGRFNGFLSKSIGSKSEPIRRSRPCARSCRVEGRLRELLLSGRENTDLEFKSSLRWNLEEGRKDREMTDAVVKTIAAFLNTQGGTLLIGVSDDRLPIGIEVDQFDDDDKFLLHLYQTAQNALGAAATALIRTSFADTPAGQVCIVDCAKSSEPVICNTKKFRDAFFVRTGPGTKNLEGDERANFVRSHWAG